ncbi:MAG: hypothetical protein ACP5NX_04185 [Candidatus Bilamarchaeaceae archaeon]
MRCSSHCFPVFLAVLLLLSAFSSAHLPDAPFPEVHAHNQAEAGVIAGHYLSSLPSSAPAPFTKAGIRILSASPSVDDEIYTSANTSFLIVWGESHSSATSPLDHDICTDPGTYSGSSFSGTITFHLSEDVSFPVSLGSTVSYVSFPLQRPDLDVAASPELLVELRGSINAEYEFTNSTPTKGGCYGWGPDHRYHASLSAPVAYNTTFLLRTGKSLPVLVNPATRQQWYRDNRFDLLVLSGCRFQRSELLLDGKAVSSDRLYLFEQETGPLGDQYITTIFEGNSTHISETVLTHPTSPSSLDPSNSAYFVSYSLNGTYEGIGQHNLSVRMYPFYGPPQTFTYSIESRAQTYNGDVLEGGLDDSAVGASRFPSHRWASEDLESLVVPLSVLGLFIIISFLRFRLGDRHGKEE